jgi:hypothetical protein
MYELGREGARRPMAVNPQMGEPRGNEYKTSIVY